MKLVIIGNGGHTQDILEILKEVKYWDNRIKQECSFYEEDIIYLDDDYEKMRVPHGLIGHSTIDTYTKLMSKYGDELRYIIGINSSIVRRKISKQLDGIYAKALPPIVHPTVIVAREALVNAEGSIIGPHCVISRGSTIGKHVHMNISSSINQNSHVGDFSTLSPGVRICGDVKIGEAVQLGANSTVINLMSVGSDSILGAGAVVTSHIPSNCTAVGVPARIIKKTSDIGSGTWTAPSGGHTWIVSAPHTFTPTWTTSTTGRINIGGFDYILEEPKEEEQDDD